MLPEREQETMFRKRHDMYVHSVEPKPRRVNSKHNSTNYSDFPRPGDYISGGKISNQGSLNNMKL